MNECILRGMHFFCKKGMRKKRVRKSAKKLFKKQNLCYSVKEANRMFRGHFTRPASAGANGRNMPSNESFNIGWRHIIKKELPTNMYSDREVYFIRILTVGFLDDYVRGNQLREIVHDKSGKDFLVYVLHLFCMKMK